MRREDDDTLIVYTCDDVQIGTDGGKKLSSAVLLRRPTSTISSLFFEVKLRDREGNEPVCDLDFSKVKDVKLGVPYVAQLRYYWEGSSLGFWGALARSFYVERLSVLFDADRMLPGTVKFLPVYNSAMNEAVVLFEQSGVSKDFGRESWSLQYVMASASPFDLEVCCKRSQFGLNLLCAIPSQYVEERAITVLEIQDVTLTDSTAGPHYRRTGEDAKVESFFFEFFTEQLRFDVEENKLYLAAVEKDQLHRFTNEQISTMNSSLIHKMRDKVELDYRRLIAATMMAAGKEGELSEELRALEEHHRKHGEEAKLESERQRSVTVSRRGGPAAGASTFPDDIAPATVSATLTCEESRHLHALEVQKPTPNTTGTNRSSVMAPQPHILRTALLQPIGPKRSRMSTELILTYLQSPSCHLSPYLGKVCSPHDLIALARDCCTLVDIDNRRERLAVKGRPIDSIYIVIRGTVEEDHGTHFRSRHEGEILGEDVLRGRLQWDVDIETTHVRPHMNQGLVHAVHKGAVPQQSLQHSLHNTLWLCKIKVVSLLRHVGRATTVTHEAANYLQCFWRFLKISPYLDQVALGKVTPVFPPESLEENSISDAKGIGGTGTGHQRHDADTAAIVRRVEEQLDRENHGPQVGMSKGRGQGRIQEERWQGLNRLEEQENALLQELRAGRRKVRTPSRIRMIDSNDGDKRKENLKKGNRANCTYHGPFGGKAIDSAALVTATPTTVNATTGTEKQRALDQKLSVAEPVRSSDLMAGAVREVMAGDVVVEQGQPRAHLILVTKGELSVFRRLPWRDLPLPYVSQANGDCNEDSENRESKQRRNSLEIDTGLRLLAGDFFFMDGAPASWVQQQQRMVETVDLKVARNRYERIDRYSMRPLFGTHRHSLAALVHAQLVMLPLWQLSRSAPLFQRLQSVCLEKYPLLSLSDKELGLRYHTQASQRVDQQLITSSVTLNQLVGVNTVRSSTPGVRRELHISRLAEAGKGPLSLQPHQKLLSTETETGGTLRSVSRSCSGVASGGVSPSFPGNIIMLNPHQASRKRGISVEAFTRESQDIRDAVAAVVASPDQRQGKGCKGKLQKQFLVQAPNNPRPSRSSTSTASLDKEEGVVGSMRSSRLRQTARY